MGTSPLDTPSQLPESALEIEGDADVPRPSKIRGGTKGANSQIHLLADLNNTSKPARIRRVDVGVLEDFILDALSYSSMRDREEEVTTAHDKTFDWIFDTGRGANGTQGSFGGQFIRWLSTNELGPIYWITGKPGSGKSTLLRFLYENPASVRHLKAWAGEKGVSLAGFFFWTSGSQEQRSQTGLLRYLLHQLLSRHRDLIPVAFPGLWERLLAMTTKERIKLSLDWTASDLMDAFQAFMSAAVKVTSICLFVDGLDEFDGDHNMIINFFKGLVTNENKVKVKLCLSSRPWPVFEAAFEYSVSNLKLQDLTHDDMYRYASDRLHENQHSRVLLETAAPGSDDLVDQVVNKADGVFLWVRLAVDQILERLCPRSSPAQFNEILHTLPAELDDLFNQLIFENKTPTQVSASGELFQLIRAREIVADFLKDESAHSLTVWELAFALDKQDDDTVSSSHVERMAGQEIKKRIVYTQTFLTRAFSGLLDIFVKHKKKDQPAAVGDNFTHTDKKADLEGKVTYIHRTVRDWLMEGDRVKARLLDSCPNDFDPHLRLLRSYILRLKHPVDEPEQHRRLNEWWPDIALGMTHARYSSVGTNRQLRRFVNQLDTTLSWYWVPRPRGTSDHWAWSAFGSYEARMKAPRIQQPFLCLATKFGLTQYIREELNARASAEKPDSTEQANDNAEINHQRSAPLLSYAIEFLCSRNKTIYPLSDPELVRTLLTSPSVLCHGPNYVYTDFTTRTPRTPWIALLRHLRDAKRRGWIDRNDTDPAGIARWSEIVQLFLHNGADPNVIVVEDKWDPEISAIGVFKMLDETYGAPQMRTLTELTEKLMSSN